MRKVLLSIFLSLTALIALLCFSSNKKLGAEEYFYQINSIVKNEEFFIGQVEGGKILLYDKEDAICRADKEAKKEIVFDGYDESIRLVHIRK